MPNRSDIRVQAVTLETARKRNEHYTQSDLDLIHELKASDVPARIIAHTIGRTLYGVRSAMKVTEERRERATPVRRAVLPYDLGYTSLEAMGF